MNDIKLRLNNILKDKFDIDLFNNIDINKSLLSKQFQLKARDIMYLLFYVEDEFKITISEYDIESIGFNTINNILNIIDRKIQNNQNGDI